MIFDGRNGGTVELLDNVLVIRRKGVASFLTQGLKGEKRIPYSSIRSVQFKEAGFTTGYIQFGVAGGNESRGGVWDATTDENTVLFTKDASPDFHRLRDLVEQRTGGARAGSVSSQSGNIAEELTRLADLRDRGVLSEEEFAQQKALLLGSATSAPSATERGATQPAPSTNIRSRITPDPVLPAQKQSGVGRIFGIGCLAVIGIFILLTIIGSQVEKTGGSKSIAPNDTSPGVVAGSDAKAVSAVELARAYDANEARAQGTYGDQPLRVTGELAGVDLDMTDDPVLHLATDNEFMPASAYLIDRDKQRASDLDKGRKITLLCQSVSEVMSMPQLKDCAIE